MMAARQGLTFGQVAARLGVDVITVRRWARTEECPVIVDGRKRRIPAEWVDDLLARGWR
ncbi:excisionase family DNA-binding protein [Mycobacterium heckeshornense]|uniref:excisionase family DNA-binding protein n=1 Tax=Mycobacterium heckeshornense TaxID=110505 RepID=UPI000A79C40E|nr:excisionase family DNA-binding protein [Mycobacterium heckeshornense]